MIAVDSAMFSLCYIHSKCQQGAHIVCVYKYSTCSLKYQNSCSWKKTAVYAKNVVIKNPANRELQFF